MGVDRENRNCCKCGGFGHLSRNCRNRGMNNKIEEGRRLKYRNNRQNNLNRKENLIVLD